MDCRYSGTRRGLEEHQGVLGAPRACRGAVSGHQEV